MPNKNWEWHQIVEGSILASRDTLSSSKTYCPNLFQTIWNWCCNSTFARSQWFAELFLSKYLRTPSPKSSSTSSLAILIWNSEGKCWLLNAFFSRFVVDKLCTSPGQLAPAYQQAISALSELMFLLSANTYPQHLPIWKMQSSFTNLVAIRNEMTHFNL